MKKLFTLVSVCCLLSATVLGQGIGKIVFVKSTDTFSRKSTPATYPITIKVDSLNINPDSLKLYTVTVNVNDKETDIASSFYSLNFNKVTLDKLKSGYTFYITIEPDKEADRTRKIGLNVTVVKSGKPGPVIDTKGAIMNIHLKSSRAVNQFSYLAYVGTNFDMVDGVRAKDLFFATSIYAPPLKADGGFGFSLTLYGNRTLSTVDSSLTTYPSRIVPIGGDSARYFTNSATRVITQAADNLGAMFSPMFRLGGLSDSKKQIQLYYSPQIEFIWRRIKMTTAYNNSVAIDSSVRANRPISRTIILNPPIETVPLNVYDVYTGLVGFALRHENENISVRVQASTGLNWNFTRDRGVSSASGNDLFSKKMNLFTYVRAWITEPVSGITFGAEVANVIRKSSRPYYNVTLSKALNLSTIGSIFSPITAR